MIYCSQCGAENAGDGRYCSACGADLPRGGASRPASADLGATRIEAEPAGDELPAGTVFGQGRYRIEALLGKGGMGAVYRAQDLKLEVTVALKVIHSDLLGGTAGIERLRNEVRVARSLKHDGVVQVFDLGSEQTREFFTMEHVEGPTLREVMEGRRERGEPFSLEETTEILLPLLDALGYAHERGVVHRDVKPENVLLVGGDLSKPKLMDFGIAKALEAETFTRTSLALGTPEYVAPEQMRDAAHVDARADLYSVGVLLYELLTGERPAGRFRMPSDLRPDLSAAVDELIDGLLQPRPAGRPATAAEVKEKLLEIGAGPRPTAGSGRRWPALLGGALVVALAGGGLLWFGGGSIAHRAAHGPAAGPRLAAAARKQTPHSLVRAAAATHTTAPAPTRPAPIRPLPTATIARAGLVVRSNVSGDRVLIDGKDVGASGPGAHEVQPGRHSVRVEKEGYEAYEAEVEVEAGVSRALHAALTPRPALLRVEANVAGAEVWVDGARAGQAAGSALAISAGTRRVKVVKDGYKPYEATVEMGPGQERALSVKLESEGPPDMVRVPAGEFWYSCNGEVDSQCDSDEKPGKKVQLDEFWIDRTEVTVGAYGKCVRAGRCSDSDTREYCNSGKAGRSQHPVNCVDWGQAKTYCAWAGKRLPTEQEWEKAARGTDGRKYPWGNNEASCRYAVISDGGWGCGRDSTWPVGSKAAGASPYGALDMAGNVWEWTASWYDSDRDGRVVRGGSWSYNARDARASTRYRNDPGNRLNLIGFRCAR